MSQLSNLTVQAAAIMTAEREVYTLPAPARHSAIILMMGRAFKQGSCEQGFILSDGTFVRRKAALLVAERAEQLIRRPTGDILTSEDIW